MVFWPRQHDGAAKTSSISSSDMMVVWECQHIIRPPWIQPRFPRGGDASGLSTVACSCGTPSTHSRYLHVHIFTHGRLGCFRLPRVFGRVPWTHKRPSLAAAMLMWSCFSQGMQHGSPACANFLEVCEDGDDLPQHESPSRVIMPWHPLNCNQR